MYIISLQTLISQIIAEVAGSHQRESDGAIIQ